MKEVTRKMVTDVAVFAVSQVAFYYAFKVGLALQCSPLWLHLAA